MSNQRGLWAAALASLLCASSGTAAVIPLLTRIGPAVTLAESEDTRLYKVVMNQEEQYSTWPVDRETPLGWTDAGKTGTKEECLAWINEVWTDMRPQSLRRAMEASGDASPPASAPAPASSPPDQPAPPAAEEPTAAPEMAADTEPEAEEEAEAEEESKPADEAAPEEAAEPEEAHADDESSADEEEAPSDAEESADDGEDVTEYPPAWANPASPWKTLQGVGDSEQTQLHVSPGRPRPELRDRPVAGSGDQMRSIPPSTGPAGACVPRPRKQQCRDSATWQACWDPQPTAVHSACPRSCDNLLAQVREPFWIKDAQQSDLFKRPVPGRCRC